jgi:hypothetical protein
MTRFGTLSPIDPAVTNDFNPQDSTNPGDRIPIAVEDVLAYFQLASQQGEDEAALANGSFRRLAESVCCRPTSNCTRSSTRAHCSRRTDSKSFAFSWSAPTSRRRPPATRS